MDVKSICALIDERQNELYETLCDLIQINSENFGATGNEQACAEYIDGLCKELNLESEVYSPLSIEKFEDNEDYLPGRNLENRYNVTAVWKGNEDVNGLNLMGHLDTVEIGDLSNWEFPPLEGIIRDSKIMGRGACDDKYALATVLFLIKILKEAGFKPKKNLVFSAYCDEELGGSHGAMAAVMKYPSERIVNLDGRQNQIWHCASGGQEISYRYHTNAIADSAEKAANAIPVVLDVLKSFAQNRRNELANNQFYAGTIIPETSVRYKEIRAGNHGIDLGIGELEFCFYTDKTKEEIYDELAQLEKILADKLAPLDITGDGFVPKTRFFHYGFAEPDCQGIADMVEAAKEATGEDVLVCGSCLSDLSVILKYGGEQSFAFGAGRDFSKPGGAHQPNEYIECDRLLAYSKMIAAYILRVLG